VVLHYTTLTQEIGNGISDWEGEDDGKSGGMGTPGIPILAREVFRKPGRRAVPECAESGTPIPVSDLVQAAGTGSGRVDSEGSGRSAGQVRGFRGWVVFCGTDGW